MSAPTRTRSQIGKASREKGARFERAVANAIKPWFPDARRSRDNGSATTSDTGDLAGTHDGLFFSLKDVAAARTEPPALINGWLAEAHVKGDDRIPLVVVKRQGRADPLMSWTWLPLGDLLIVAGWGAEALPLCSAPVRMELRHVLDLLAAAGYGQRPDHDKED